MGIFVYKNQQAIVFADLAWLERLRSRGSGD